MAEVALLAASNAMKVLGTLREGQQQEDRFNYEAKVREQQADEALAVGQRRAQRANREGRLLQSRQQAIAAMQGDTTDKSVIDILGFTERETDLNRRTEISTAQNQANSLNDAARVARIDAKRAKQNSRVKAFGQALEGASSMHERFGQGGFSGSSGGGSVTPVYG